MAPSAASPNFFVPDETRETRLNLRHCYRSPILVAMADSNSGAKPSSGPAAGAGAAADAAAKAPKGNPVFRMMGTFIPGPSPRSSI
jgi:hypothetical protein